jgi:hypothetical protein
VWSSGTVKDVHRAVEREMKTKASFKLIGERHEDMWFDGVKLNVKEVLIYLITRFGLEEKARASGCEIDITVDGAKLDDYGIHVTCGFKMTDKDARGPLHIGNNDPLKKRKAALTHHPIKQELFSYHIHHREGHQIHLQQVPGTHF